MYSYQQNANRSNMFAILEKQNRNKITIDYGTLVKGGTDGYPLSYNDSSSRTQIMKINALKSNSTVTSYVANTYNQTQSHVNLLRRGGYAAPRKVGAIKQ